MPCLNPIRMLVLALLLAAAAGAEAAPVHYRLAGSLAGPFGSLAAAGGPIALADVDLVLTVALDTDDLLGTAGGGVLRQTAANGAVRLGIGGAAGGFDLVLSGATRSRFVSQSGTLLELQLAGSFGETVLIGTVVLPGFDPQARQSAAMLAIFGPGTFQTSGGALRLDGTGGSPSRFTLNPVAVPLPASLGLALAMLGATVWVVRRRQLSSSVSHTHALVRPGAIWRWSWRTECFAGRA